MAHNKLKLLFTSPTDFKNRKLTGAHKRFVELVNDLARNNEVSLVSYKYEGFSNQNIIHYPIISNVGKFLPKHISEFFTLIKYLKKYKSYIKYDYSISFGAIISICYKFVGIKKIITLLREDIVGYQKAVNASKLKILYFYMLETIAIHVSDKIIVQCTHDKIELIKRHKRIEKKIYIQGNNLNTSWNPSISQRLLKGDNPRILFIGNFSDNRKGHSLLLPAAAHLNEDNVRFELYVLGDGKDFKIYMEKYQKYKNFHFLGHVNNVLDYLINSDIVIVPSIIDSCPNTVLEGFNAGVVVYGTNTGGIPDLLIKSNYMFEPNTENIYLFLKNKIKDKEYIKDQIDQKILKERFIFDWGLAIEKIIIKN